MEYKVKYTVGERFNPKTFKKEIVREKVEEKEVRGKKRREKKRREKRFLVKPKIKGITRLDPVKAVMQGTGNIKLVKEVETPEIVEDDDRSLFFKEEFIKEKKESMKWF